MYTNQWLEKLLLLPTMEQQLLFLEESNLLNEDDLEALLNLAMKQARSHPDKARHLTILCTEAAHKAKMPAIIPRATYFRAQTYASNGEFNKALVLIKEARKNYEAQGKQLEAWRTNAGLINVLNELGRHQEAIQVADGVLQALATNDIEGDSKQIKMLVALMEQNKGVCYDTTGRYEEALKAYTAAEAAFTDLLMAERIADISNNRGIALVSLGRVSEALLAFEAAAQIRHEAGLTLLYAQTKSNIGEAHLMMGNYTRSLEAFTEARQLFSELSAQAHQHILLSHTANAYLALNLHPEALTAYREVAKLLQDAGMSTRLAHVLLGMGAALIREYQLEEAEKALGEAATLFTKADNMPMISTVMLEQAALQDAHGEREKAIKTTNLALTKVADKQKWPVEQVVTLLRLVDLLLPDTNKAFPHLMAARQLLEKLTLPPIEYRINQRLGRLYLLKGQLSEAQGFLEAAVMQIEQLRGTLAQEALRTSFLQDKTAAYEDLIALHLEGGNQIRAFAIAEQAKSRTLVDLLAGVNKRSVSDDTKITNKLERLQADLSAIYNQFLTPNKERLNSLQAQAIELEQQIRHLRLQGVSLENRDPFGTPLEPDELMAQLPAGLILLTYHIVGDEILAFVVQQQIQVVRALSQVPIIHNLLQRLNIQWDRFRAGGVFAKRHIKQLERSTQRVLAALYNNLIMPLEPLIGGSEKIVIVPHGVLHQVPFHALHDGKQYLIDRFIISYAPSATIFVSCQYREQKKGKAFVVGVPDPLIPAVSAETKIVAQQLTGENIATLQFEGEQATLASLREKAQAVDILHLACHGLFRADNPMFSALKLYDGWLTAANVMELDLRNSLVTLSACESGRSQVILGDEVIGLPRAFLGAGAATLLVTLWLVLDQTTAILMENWYKELATHQPATALRMAQLALKAEYPHPYYWAPFVLIGKRN